LCAWLVSAGVHAPEPYTVPAAAVLLVPSLVAVGATYEARLRDLGRLRTALGRMR
jgi:hypothetical protein